MSNIPLLFSSSPPPPSCCPPSQLPVKTPHIVTVPGARPGGLLALQGGQAGRLPQLAAVLGQGEGRGDVRALQQGLDALVLGVWEGGTR